jgi:uncharacterized protein (TIRG00374 family)
MQRRFFFIQVLISIAALAGVVFWVIHQHVPSLPDGGRVVAYAVLAVAIYAIATLGRGERWHRVLRLIGAESNRRDAYSLTTVGYMGNNTMPARAGDLLKTGLTASRTRSPYPEILGAAVAERVLDAVTLGGFFMIIGGLVVHDTSGLPSGGALAAILVALAAVICGGYVLLRTESERHLIRRAQALTRSLGRPSKALLSRRGAALLVFSIAIWALEATVYYLVGDALNLGLTPVDSLYLVALTNLVALIPAAPGYVGTFDAAVLFGVRALVGGLGGTTYALMLRLVLFGPITIVGLVLLVTRYGGLSRLRALRRQEVQEVAA